jgi:hypothetical protein
MLKAQNDSSNKKGVDMKNMLMVGLLCLLVAGCAEMSNYRKENYAKIDGYFQSPNNNMMVVVDAVDKTLGFPLKIQCHNASGSLSDPGANNNSFETLTPYVEILPLGETINKMKNEYASLPKNEQDKFALQSAFSAPMLSLTCQCQDAFGIQGKIYLNGREVSSSIANVDYGVVTLSYTLTLEEIMR